jgi:hypothetical protein
VSPIITKPMQTITERHNQTRVVSSTCFRPLPPIPKYKEETPPPPPPPPKHISQVWRMLYLKLILIKGLCYYVIILLLIQNIIGLIESFFQIIANNKGF